MKIAIFIGSFGLGGAQSRILRYFFPYWTRREETQLSLILLQRKGEFLTLIPENIEVYDVGETIGMKLPSTVLRAGRVLRGLKPDIVISFMWYPALVSFLVRKTGLVRFKHIVHETLNMTGFVKEYFNNEKYISLKRFLIKSAYSDSNKVIAVSGGVKKDLIQNFGVPREKIEVIYNPLDRELIARMASEVTLDGPEGPFIVASGRLTHQKGFDILLKAFRKVRDVIRSRLVILGEGDAGKELKALAHALKLDRDVIFAGFQQNPFKFIAGATVFCSASRYEGFSNAILEAMAFGLPIVATDCPSGPAEVMDQGRYGVLVPPENPDAMADVLIRVLSDRPYRETLSGLSSRRARDFDSETIMREWEDVCCKI